MAKKNSYVWTVMNTTLAVQIRIKFFNALKTKLLPKQKLRSTSIAKVSLNLLVI